MTDRRFLAADGRPTCGACLSQRFLESESGAQRECQDCPDFGDEGASWEDSPIRAVEARPEVLGGDVVMEPGGTTIPAAALARHAVVRDADGRVIRAEASR